MNTLNNILKGVSRSFYLSLVLLPKKARGPMGLAFLACKTADTIADTTLIPKQERLKLLDAYREMFATNGTNVSKEIVTSMVSVEKGNKNEVQLIQSLPRLMEALKSFDVNVWRLIQELVLEVTQGMQMDLQYFPGERVQELKAFDNEGQLERYIYLVAGCVGRFWTKMMRIHFSFAKNFCNEVENLGEELGKGLQLVNILRDLPQDLQKGRCYIPQDLLRHERLIPLDLLDSKNGSKTKPLLDGLIQKAKKYLQVSDTYCGYFPWYAIRLKAVVRLPARLGLKTLALLENANDWLKPQSHYKVSRGEVYKTLLKAFLK